MKTLKIGLDDNANQIVATTVFVNGDNFILEDLSGWDDFPEHVRATAEKISGDGSFVSPYSRKKEKTLTVIISALSNSNSVRELRERLAYWETIEGFIKLELTRVENGVTTVEVYDSCYISSPTLWKQSGDSYAAVNLAYKTSTPWKSRSVDGAEPTNVL
jgi:hypothetical protein